MKDPNLKKEKTLIKVQSSIFRIIPAASRSYSKILKFLGQRQRQLIYHLPALFLSRSRTKSFRALIRAC